MPRKPNRGIATTTATLALASAGVVTVLAPPTAQAATQVESTGNPTVDATATPGTVDPRYRRKGANGRPASTQGRTRAATEDLATLRVLVRDRLGSAPSTERASYALAFDLASGDLTVVALTDGAGTAQVAAGSYLVQSFVETVEHAGVSLSMPMDTLVTVDGSASAVLDARDTARVGASVDRPDARLTAGTVQVTRSTPGRKIWYAADFDYPAGLYVKPTGPVEGLDLNVYAALSQHGSRTSPYLYHLTFEAADGIPRRPEFTARSRDLAAVPIRINGQNAGGCGRIGARGRDLDLPAGFGASVTAGAVPGSYQEYFTPGTDVQWTPTAEILPPDCAQATGGDYFIRQRTYPATGSYPLVFGRGPIGPTLTADDPARPPAHREDNVMSVAVPMYADADSWHGGPTAWNFVDYPYATGSTTLARADGTVVGSVDRSGYGSFEAPAQPTRYVLTTESTRTAPWSDLSRQQRIQWSFTSAHEAGTTALPLLAVRYDLATDSLNRAPAGTSLPLSLSVERSGSTTPPAIRLVTLAASLDDGKSWRNLTVTRTGNRWTTKLPATIGRGYVSLRATAVDLDGNRVEQTVIRAYAVAP